MVATLARAVLGILETFAAILVVLVVIMFSEPEE